MKHFSLLSGCCSNAKGSKIISLLFLLLIATVGRLQAAIGVSPAGSGTNICASYAVGGSEPGYYSIGGIVIYETAVADFNGTSITLSPPTGWQFNTSAVPTIFPSGSGLAASASFSGGDLVISVTLTGTHATNINNMLILGLEVQATSTAAAPGNITNTAQLGTWTGLSLGTNIGSLSLEAQPGTVTVGGGGTFCGSSTDLTASGGAGGTIYFQGTTSLGTSTSSSSLTQSVTSSGTYYFRPRAASGCWGYDGSATVTLNPLPTVTAGSSVAICDGNNTTLTAGGASTYTWAPGAGLSATTGASVTASPTVTTTYTVTGTDALTCSNTATVTVTVNPLPAAIGGTLDVCVAATTTLTNATGGGTWSSSNGNVTIGSVSGIVTGVSAGTSVVSYILPTSCFATAIVTVNALPTVSGGSNVQICDGNSTTLTASGAVTYTWAPSGSLSASTGASVTASPTTTTTYTVTGTNSNGCVNTANVTVTVNAIPTAVTVGTAGTYCQSTTLTASGGTGGTIYFQGTTSAGTSTVTPSTSQIVTATGTYYFRAQSGPGCWGPEGSVTVSINPNPAAITGIGGGSVTTTFSYTGSSQTFTVPSGVTSIDIEVYGAGGGNAADRLTSNATGGAGSKASGALAVTGGDVLQINVGGAGLATGAGGFNGGGNGGTASAGSTCSGGGAGGGGGASDVRTGAYTLSDRVIVGAGGGGSGRDYCNGSCQPCGCGGSGGAGDFDGVPAGNCGFSYGGSGINFGAKGLVGSAGAGGTGDGGGTSGVVGSFGAGGVGAAGAYDVSGGGGGGGYYGGGGGGGAVGGSGVGGGGGGGGSSYTGGVSGGSTTTSSNTGNGVVLLTYPSTEAKVCVGSTTTLNCTTAGGTWSSSNGNVTIDNTTGVASGVTVGTAVITYTLISTGCYSTTVMTVNALPTVGAGSDVAICNGSNTTLTATGAVTYVWAPAASLSASTGTSVTASPTTTTVYTVNGTDANGCTNAAAVAVTVNPLPAAVTASGGGTFCNNTTITASGGGGGTIYFQGTTSNGTSTATPSVSEVVTVTGTYYFRAQTALGCWGAESSVSVTINPNAGAVTASGAGTYCGNATITASGGSGGTIYFQGTTSNGTSTATPSSSEVVTSSGTYYFRARTAAGCWGPEGSVTVTINAYPTVASITPSATNLCSGTALTLTAGSVTGTGSFVSYNWSGPNAYSTTSAGNTAVFTPTTSAASGAYSVTVTYTGTGCTSTAAVTSPNVTVNPTPGPITGNAIVCQGSTETLANSVGGGTWSSSNTAVGTINSSSGALTGIAVGTTVITYTATGPCIATRIAEVIALPTVTSASGTQVCIGTNGTVNATPSTDAIIKWYDASTGGTLLGSGNSLVITAPTATATYYAEASNVSAGPLDAAPAGFSTRNGEMFDISTFKAVTLSGFDVMANPGTYDYEIYYKSGTFVGNESSSASWTLIGSFPANAAAGTGYRTFTLPATVDLAAGQVYGFYITSTGTGVENAVNYGTGTTLGATIASNADMSIGEGSVLTEPFTGVAFSPRAAIVKVNYTAPGCASATRTATVLTVNALPTVSSITPSASTVCTNSTLTLFAGSVTGVGTLTSYNWSGPNSFNTTTTTVSTAFTPTTTASSGVYTLSVTYPGVGCTSSEVTTSVTVNVQPTVSAITASADELCEGATLTLTGSGASGTGSLTSYNWTGPNAYSATTSGNSASVSSLTTSASGIYSLTVTYPGGGCTSNPVTTSPAVTVNALPTVASITPSTTTACVGLPLTFTAGSTTGTGSLTSYNWSGPNGYSTTTSVGSASFVPTTTAYSGVYSLTVTYQGVGCTSSATTTAYVSVVPKPDIYNVTGGGVICAGDAGVHIGLDWSIYGIDYQLYNSSGTPIGSPVGGSTSGLDFGLINTAGTYTVVATNTSTGCQSDMAGSATVTVNPLPTAYAVTGGGTTCENSMAVSVGLANSETGITYQLYNGSSTTGSPVAGTGAAISFGAQNVSGTYSVRATNNTTSCVNGMTGSVVVSINPAPAAYALTGGGNYCSGGSGLAIGLANSTTGIDYQLYNGASTVGSPVAGTGAAISFGTYTAAGTYTVLATNTSTTCTGPMSGNATIVINPLPTTYSVTGGGAYCAGGSGVAVGLSFSATGINYQLYNGASAIGSPVAGTGSAISFGSQTLAGTYTVLATDATTSCTNAMTGSAVVIMNALPVAQTVTGGGAFCTGGSGVPVGLGNSETGISYQLYNGASTVGTPLDGTGAAISFGNQATAGTYTVVGTNTVTTCTNAMSGSATVIVNPLPTQYIVTGGGDYCAGGSGVAIGLNSSNTGISYQLYNGASVSGSPIDGTGSAVSFGSRTASGTYSVVATNTVTACVSNMFGSVAVVINPLPTQYTVTGGGNYCAGGSGVEIGLSTTNAGISYQLYNGGSPAGSAVAGTGAAISFGSHTASGTYTVLATNNTTLCTNAMANSVSVVIDPLPNVQTVTGGGTYCQYGAGVAVGLASSQTGINYQLYNGATAMGSPVAGTGSAVSFGNQTLAGTYTVLATDATTFCTNAMSGNAVVIMNPAPTAYAVTGGGAYCAGGAGVAVGVANSQTGISYQLYNGGTAVGSPVAGTGSAISFGNQTLAATYTVLGTNTVTGCTNPMTGNAVVIMNPLPTAYAINGGGAYCSGGSGVAVGLTSSQSGINYQLYRGATPVGSAVAGTGTSITFGNQTTAGTYTILATNATTGCIKAMTGSVGVTVNALPVVQAVTGGGNACSGGAGAHIGLASSEVGINYQAFIGSTAVTSPIGGSGDALDLGQQWAPGSYTIVGVNATTGCTSTMAGSATVVLNAPPTVYSVTGGGTYCSGGSGVAVGLSNSASTASYRLYIGTTAVGSPVTGTGSAISFGSYTTAATYTVLATNIANACYSSMTGSATVGINPLPTAYNLAGGGNYCPGTSGATITLDGSNTGIVYQMYLGSSVTGAPVTGTGSALNMGIYSTTGTYSVHATNILTGCVNGMAGTVSISPYTPPTVYTVTGGGAYCTGSTPPSISLTSSQAGVNYGLYLGSTLVTTMSGTGMTLNFGPQATPGTYSVLATSTTTSCTSQMTGTVSVSVNSLPLVYNVGGGGSYCATGSGVAVTLNGSATGVNYQLMNGSTATGAAVAGTGAPLNFGLMTAAGTYTVRATNTSTGCVSNMAGNAIVIVNPLPVAYDVSGGGAYCSGSSGVSVGLSGSESAITYTLYRGGTLVGSPVTGGGSSFSFGIQTVAGTYTVQAVNSGTGCSNAMNGGATVSVNPLPSTYTITGGGNYCAGGAGVPVGLSWSDAGVSYQLYNGSTATGSAVAGLNGPLDFGMKTATGTYSVRATNTSTSCVNDMTGTVAVGTNPLPGTYNITGGGTYCAGSVGVEVGLSGSEAGVNYSLYNGSTLTGSPVVGTGSAISFGANLAGTYTVLAVDASTACQSAMTGIATVLVNAQPVAFTVSGGGTHCAGSTGSAVTLSSSQSGVTYKLYNGSTFTGVSLAGTGSALNFGAQSSAGTYTVLATNNSTACTRAMTGSAVVIVNAAPTAYAVTGGGNYCAGGAGVAVGLSGSQSGVLYQLYRGIATTGSPVAGTGSAISFGNQTANGVYSVSAVVGSTSCSTGMTGTVTVNANPLPVAYSMLGGGAYCAGGSGVNVSLGSSNAGVTYQLYNGSSPVGLPTAGTGFILHFGFQTAAGTYTVLATDNLSGCTKAMNGSAPVVVNTLPPSHDVTGGGAYCEGGTGVAVGISGTETGIAYTLYRGSTVVASSVPGTGGALSFGMMTAAGTYTVSATNSSTGCMANMGSNAVVTVNARPLEFDVTGGGGYCSGGTGVHIGVGNSQVGVSYQLYNGASMAGAALAGTGDMLDFGAQTSAGTYSVLATNTTTGCVRAMAGTAPVVINTPPAVYAVTGGGNYCEGGAGVDVGVAGSDFGITYRLYKDGSLTGTPVAGTGFAISFGMQTGLGAYTVVAENAANSCTTTMLGSAVVGNSTPPVAFNLSAGGSYCAGGTGVELSLDGSESGVDYRLYNGSTATGIIVGGTGSEIDFGAVPAGSYSVLAVNSSTSCSSDMNGIATVSMNTLPTAFAVTGGGAYCAGSSVTVGLSGSQSNVSYQLYNGSTAIGSPMTGTGTALNFGTVAEGVYSVRATSAITGCVGGMTGAVTASMNAQPNAYAVTGGGSLCSGAAGVNISLSGSQTGVNYTLYNGTTAVGSAIAGTGLALNFGAQAASGDYTVMAVNATTSCSRLMTGSANVVVNPTPTAYDVTGGGSYCPGTSGVHIGLSGSTAGVSYQLYRGSVMVGSATAGTGGSIDFGSFTDAGAYMVVATNSTTSCTANMNGTVTVGVNAQPVAQALVASSTGYCAGSAGVEFTLGNTQVGATYRLYNGTTLVGGPVAGTGSGISFGFKTMTGMYTAVATDGLNGCMTTMTGTPSIVMHTLPDIFAVSGGGAYCGGTAGSTVSLLSSQSGMNYQLYRGATMSGSAVAGTGSAITFGPQSAGTYTVQAIDPVTGCRSNMSGSASVIMNPAPAVFTVTGGGQYCAGSTGVHVGLSGSVTGIKYRLYNGTTPVGLAVNGTGSPIDFGAMTAGSYMVVASNPITSCTSNMTGTATVIMNATPTVHVVSGGGAVCAGSTGAAIMLDGSETGITYRAYNGSSAAGTSVAGTGSGITVGSFNASGTYTVRATDAATSCTAAMTGSAIINVNALPAIQTVTGGGNYCEGGSGSVIGLGGSAEGVDYTLYHGASIVSTVAGTGFAVSFAPATAVGTYTVMAVNATTGCSRAMLGDATVATTPTVAPTVVLNSASGDTLCAGVPAAFSTTITNGGAAPAYTWKVNGVTMSSTTATFSYLPANGDVVAVSLASSATCATPATATASRTFTVIESQMPSVTAEITGGDTLCEGSEVTITAVPTFGGSTPAFTWVKNGVPSSSGASFTFTPMNGDVVYVRMTSNYQCRLASLVSGDNDTLSVIVALAPTVGITSDKGTSINKGEALTLTATAVNTYKPTYQWYLNGALVHGATMSTFTYASYEDKDTVSCRVANNTPCGEYASVNTVMINVSSVGVANVGNAAFDVRIVPNPTNGNFVIKGQIESAGSDDVTFEITDMLGQTVHTGRAQLKNGAINAAVTLNNSLANGMYMVSLHAGGSVKVFHLVLQQ